MVPAAPCSPLHRAVDHVVVAEQRARLVHAAVGDQAPQAGAADDELLVAHRIDLLGLEPVAGAERPQQREVAAAVPAEQEVGADADLRHLQPFDEHRPDEPLRIPLRELRREAHDGGGIHAGRGEGIELLGLRHQQRRRLVGTHDARRMRIEGQGGRGGVALVGAAPHLLDDPGVPAVHAVEVAEREDRLLPAGGPWVVRIVNDIHARSRHDNPEADNRSPGSLPSESQPVEDPPISRARQRRAPEPAGAPSRPARRPAPVRRRRARRRPAARRRWPRAAGRASCG